MKENMAVFQNSPCRPPSAVRRAPAAGLWDLSLWEALAPTGCSHGHTHFWRQGIPLTETPAWRLLNAFLSILRLCDSLKMLPPTFSPSFLHSRSDLHYTWWLSQPSLSPSPYSLPSISLRNPCMVNLVLASASLITQTTWRKWQNNAFVVRAAHYQNMRYLSWFR